MPRNQSRFRSIKKVLLSQSEVYWLLSFVVKVVYDVCRRFEAFWIYINEVFLSHPSFAGCIYLYVRGFILSLIRSLWALLVLFGLNHWFVPLNNIFRNLCLRQFSGLQVFRGLVKPSFGSHKIYRFWVHQSPTKLLIKSCLIFWNNFCRCTQHSCLVYEVKASTPASGNDLSALMAIRCAARVEICPLDFTALLQVLTTGALLLIAYIPFELIDSFHWHRSFWACLLHRRVERCMLLDHSRYALVDAYFRSHLFFLLLWSVALHNYVLFVYIGILNIVLFRYVNIFNAIRRLLSMLIPIWTCFGF